MDYQIRSSLPTAYCEKIVFMVQNHHFYQRSELAKQSTSYQ
jgi:hypothetical protein